MTDEGAAVERLRLGYIQTALRQRDRLVARAEAAEAESSVACGMVTQYQTKDWRAVECENCHAAHRADEAAS